MQQNITRFIVFLTIFTLLLGTMMVQAQDSTSQLLADFEFGSLFEGQDSNGSGIGFIPWGDMADNVTLDLVVAEDDLALPDQEGENTVLAVTYDIATFGGFTHAFTDETDWLSQDWTEFNTLEFWFYGAGSGADIQIELFDNRAKDAMSDSAERWYYRFVDDFNEWQYISIPFVEFQRRTDWQPSGAPSDGLGLTEVHGYAFAFPAGVGAYTSYIDDVSITFIEENGMVESMSDPDTADEIEPEVDTLAVELPEYNADGEWELVWSDEFDAEENAPIDDTFWTCETGGWGWGNAESQYYTDRLDNVAHSGDGHLVITAREEEYRGNEYTSARCITMDKLEFTYGKIEARINLPEGQGIWPAFWMLGANFPEIGWPDSGEIDIMEYIGAEIRSAHGTVHGPGYSGAGGIGGRYIHEGPIAEDFHVFSIEWEPEVIRWFVNGENYFEITPEFLFQTEWVFDHDFFMLINIAVGGNWPGYPDDTTEFPQEMLIDWIRIYQRQ